MSFNLGLSNHSSSRLGGLSSVGVYLYEDIYYRQWITEIALAMYEGRQDEFVWLDLVKQFRNPEKQQILPVNLTKEIIDEISILYREEPIYQVVDEDGKLLKDDQKLWEEIQDHSKYHQIMDRLDRWCNLLGTVLVKVSFVDENNGMLVKETKPGKVQLDLLHGGSYDIRHGASPYYITELLIGFGNKFQGFQGGQAGNLTGGNILGAASVTPTDAKSIKDLGPVNRIYWSPDSHTNIDEDGKEFKSKNPYGLVPAVPFFNMDPAHYYFLPINEPLIYANHALNMRITDLNHIAKFQSFGVPVIKGVERATSLRHGRPVDDMNQLKGGTAQSRFGGISGISGFGAGGQFRNFDSGFGIFRDGNADAAALGLTLGPDTAVAVGEKGDFKFAHPSADILGLVKTIHSLRDMVRINHGLRPKHDQQLPPSGFALMLDKMGVIENNIRRSRIFKERERQLFQVVKTLWNVHHSKSGDKKFSDKAKLDITYRQPEFPTDPKTQMETIAIENLLLDSGDRRTYKKLYPHLSEADINKLIKQRRKDKQEQALSDTEIKIEQTKKIKEDLGEEMIPVILTGGQSINEDKKDALKVSRSKIDNKVKHSEASSKQPGKNGDTRRN